MIARLALLAIAPLPLLLGACAAPAEGYPSLAQRDIERVDFALAAPQTIPAPPPGPAEPVLRDARDLLESVRTVHAAFLAGEDAARSRVAAAQGSGTEAWAVAEVALAGLSSQRSRAMVALADLDRIYIEASNAGESTEVIGSARSEAESMVARQDEVLSELTARLAR